MICNQANDERRNDASTAQVGKMVVRIQLARELKSQSRLLPPQIKVDTGYILKEYVRLAQELDVVIGLWYVLAFERM